MAWMHPDAIEYRKQRFMRPDAERYRKPDPEHWLSPQELQLEYPELYERKYGAALPPRAERPERVSTLDIVCSDETLRLRVLSLLRAAQVDVAMLRRELALRRKYSPDQPRVPAGNPDGGQWTEDGSSTGRIRFAENRDPNTITDAWGNRYYNPGGHHEVPRGVYRHWNLRPETRRVFDQATTGPIPDVGIRSTPDSPTYRHAWKDPGGGLHGAYNDAVRELGERFLKENNLTPEQMTPDHARALLKEIRDSDDPRIRDFNDNMRRIRRLFRPRPGAD